MFGIDPLIATILVAGGLLWIGFKAGQWDLHTRIKAAIDFTMGQMIAEGYVFAERDRDGDTVIVPLTELSPPQLLELGHKVVDPSVE